MRSFSKKTRRCKIPTDESLRNAALFYLQRFAASEASLKRVLENKIKRAAFALPEFAENRAAQDALKKTIDAIVAQHVKMGTVNDAAFTETKLHSLRRKGQSARMISQKLKQKGIEASLIAQTLEDAGEDSLEAELQAALRLLKKKGVTQGDGTTLSPERQKRLTATLCRAGFSFDIIRKALALSLDDSGLYDSLTMEEAFR